MTMRIALLAALVSTAWAGGASAQTTAPVEHINCHRPESWAMQYYTSITFFNGALETTSRDQAGSIAIGLETEWVPRLTTEQQEVGFSGKAYQDLNKAPVLLRPRV